MKILITGEPGIGKTTLIKKVSDKLDKYCIKGFYTLEIRECGKRKGFDLKGFNNETAILSHINIQTAFKVGKYGVDILAFELFLDSIDFFSPKTELIIIDEIGKMECFSSRFVDLIHNIFRGDRPVIATVALKGSGIISEIKKQPDIRIIKISKKNRNQIPKELLQLVKNIKI
jgi:nucleoside-triphosphatase